MPLQNRVAPNAELHAVPAFGTLMGNRGGRFHDAQRQLKNRHWVGNRWIACETEFKNRRRRIWGDSYTELFFLDEVTALAAGHRPCFECRRGEAKAFVNISPLKEFDRQLHAERMARHEARAAALPQGSMIEHDGCFLARHGHRWLRWSFGGYDAAFDIAPGVTARLLTPPLITAILANGYQPRWHPSAQQWDT